VTKNGVMINCVLVAYNKYIKFIGVQTVQESAYLNKEWLIPCWSVGMCKMFPNMKGCAALMNTKKQMFQKAAIYADIIFVYETP
jgi:hypothetical protein